MGRQRLGWADQQLATDPSESEREPIPARDGLRFERCEVLFQLGRAAEFRQVEERRSQRLDQMEVDCSRNELRRRRTLLAAENAVRVDQPLTRRGVSRPRPGSAKEDELVRGVQDERRIFDSLMLERTHAEATDPLVTELCRQRGRYAVMDDKDPAARITQTR
jgi:hypothetical protein